MTAPNTANSYPIGGLADIQPRLRLDWELFAAGVSTSAA
jgi:hypothetical protein